MLCNIFIKDFPARSLLLLVLPLHKTCPSDDNWFLLVAGGPTLAWPAKNVRPLGPKIAAKKKGGNWKCQLAVEPFFVHIFYKFFFFFPEQRGTLVALFAAIRTRRRTPSCCTIYFSNVRRRESPPPPFSGQKKISAAATGTFFFCSRKKRRENVQVFGKRFNCAPLTDTTCRFL